MTRHQLPVPISNEDRRDTVETTLWSRPQVFIYSTTSLRQAVTRGGFSFGLPIRKDKNAQTLSRWRWYYPYSTSLSAMRKMIPLDWNPRDQAPCPISNVERTDTMIWSRPKVFVYATFLIRQGLTQSRSFLFGLLIRKHMDQGQKNTKCPRPMLCWHWYDTDLSSVNAMQKVQPPDWNTCNQFRFQMRRAYYASILDEAASEASSSRLKLVKILWLHFISEVTFLLSGYGNVLR